MSSPLLGTGDRRLLLCLGPGGVGKTTLAAALALSHAVAGAAVAVMTIDPAPRLLDALALGRGEPGLQDVALDGLGAGARAGRLRAQRLDPGHTFDALVVRHAPSEAAREAILRNRIYRNLSGALAGVADYMAMERLLELSLDPQTALVVVDTPPAAEALEFIEAPRRMLELLNSRALALLGASGNFVRRRLSVLDLPARAVLAAFDRVTGLNLLGDVQAFVRSFEGMYAGFAERAARVRELISSPACLVVLVTTAEPGRAAEVREFAEPLGRAGLSVGAVVVNRVMPELPDAAEIRRLPLAPPLRRKLIRNVGDFAALKRREALAVGALRENIPEGARLYFATDLGSEPRTLADLLRLARGIEPG